MALLTIILAATNEAEHIMARPDADVPDRTEAYEAVSTIWAEATGGLPYPIESHHFSDSDTSNHTSNSSPTEK